MRKAGKVEREKPDFKERRMPHKKRLETSIGSTTEIEVIQRAVDSSLSGLIQFVSPKDIASHPELRHLHAIKHIVEERIHSVGLLVTDIILSINQRAEVVRSNQYRELVRAENTQWRDEDEPMVEHGVRVCVDAGVPREAVAGGDGVHMGRSLAGDDNFSFSPTRHTFHLDQSTFLKRMIHNHRDGQRTILEILIEHTRCGRRGQMIANHHTSNEISHLYKIVFNNIMALLPEFTDDLYVVNEGLKKIAESWAGGNMVKDGGAWAGTLVKIAQRQAYKQIAEGFTPVVPIEIFDKMNGDLIVGVDTMKALTHPKVLAEGGYTDEALRELAQEDTIFSLEYELGSLERFLSNNLTVKKGQHTFEDLQNQWIVVKQSFLDITESLWELYQSDEQETAPFKEMVHKFLSLSLGPVKKSLDSVDNDSDSDGITADLMVRRHIHHLFRVLAYAWSLDTITKGNPPGNHIEDHLATGDSAVLGVTTHLSLGQGDLQPPTVNEFITGYSVLMHSKPGHDGLPVVVVMKHDTSQPDDKSLTTEETERASADFKELLKLWPYVVVGDIVPIIAVRGKDHGGVNRLALSVILSFGDIISLSEQRGELAKFVPASNSQGKVVNVPASEVLKAGVKAGSDLRAFRENVREIADNFSSPEVQSCFN